ncbi:MAG: hypothetical protein CMP10_11445 [Zetaproteobacteria bacterium]|nr:hypothetical protein [Pseudobdellovibrionaceae bacterium]
MRHIVFAIPDQIMVSGGNIYNREIMQSLKNLGYRVTPFYIPIQSQDKKSMKSWWQKLCFLEPDYVIEDALCYDFLERYNESNDLFPRLALFHASQHSLVDLNKRNEAKKCESRYLPKVNGAIFTSQFLLDSMQEMINKDLKYTVIEPGLDHVSGDFGSVRNKSSQLNLLMVGLVNSNKQQLEVAAEVAGCKENLKMRLLCIGRQGTQKSYISRFNAIVADQNCIDWINETNWPQLGNYMFNTDIYICASLSESYGMAMMESASLGAIPVVIGQTGAARIIREMDIGFNIDRIDELGDLLGEIYRQPERINFERHRLNANLRKKPWLTQAKNLGEFLDLVRDS